jgi:flagellum-specific peptidoglycan hydrolase FlgJ
MPRCFTAGLHAARNDRTKRSTRKERVVKVETTANTGAAAASPSIETPRTSQRTGKADAGRTASFLRALLHQAQRAVDWWRNDPMTARFDAERRRHGIY